ncbi:MAG: hypothetical protein IKL89_03230 [Clostridia bacterium]|nr:hypothetical protein [Clostridia bacterium]
MKNSAGSKRLLLRELVLFPMLGVIMFVSVVLMAVLPNIHLIGTLIVVFTLTFRWKALIPIYIFVFLDGLYFGFSPYWAPYLYAWALLWAAVMILPKKMPTALKAVVYPAVSGVHGLLFGVLGAPLTATLLGVSPLAWIASGIGYDITHGIGNLVGGLLILPLTNLMNRLYRQLMGSSV